MKNEVLFEKNENKNFLIINGLKVYYENYTTAYFMIDEIFNKQIYNFALKKKRPLILDVGANIGLATLFFKSKFPESTIHAFEPSPKSFGFLKKNIEVNTLSNISLHNIALADYDGKLNLYHNSDLTSPTISSSKHRSGYNTLLICCHSIHKYTNCNIDLLKIDVEGMEYILLNNLVEHNKLKFVSNLIIEYHHHIDKENDCFASILSLLENNNFGYQILSELEIPIKRKRFQDILIYAYKKW